MGDRLLKQSLKRKTAYELCSSLRGVFRKDAVKNTAGLSWLGHIIKGGGDRVEIVRTPACCILGVWRWDFQLIFIEVSSQIEARSADVEMKLFWVFLSNVADKEHCFSPLPADMPAYTDFQSSRDIPRACMKDDKSTSLYEMAAICKRQKEKGISNRIYPFAERIGFEPTKPFRGLHAFQACLFNHSSTSPCVVDTLIGVLRVQR